MSTKLANSHIHSRFSFDSKQSVRGICARAKQLGLCAITITDHCEISESGQSPYWSMNSLRAARERIGRADCRNAMRVLTGIELGQPMHNQELAAQVLNSGRYDLVLASVHYLRDGRDFYYLDYHEFDPYEVYDKYLSELLETVSWGHFDALAHMTYPLRYVIGRDEIAFDESIYEKRYDELLALLAEKGKALEINTAGLHSPDGIALPGINLVKRFRELGGRYITLGSDAHKADKLGVGLEYGADIARHAGFDRIVYYVDHQPVEILLDAKD